MTKTNLLVITSAGHMSDDQHAKLTARVEAVASKVGAEVLVLGPGQDARLINVGVMPSKATAVEIKEGLRSCSAARTDYYSDRLGGGVAGRSDLLEGIDRLRKEMRVQVDQILKRVEDTGALLYRWDRAGMPAAHVDCGVDAIVQEGKPMAAVEGMAISYCLDPLEQGIEQAVRLVAEAEGELAVKLSRHLDALLAIQLEWVTSHEHH